MLAGHYAAALVTKRFAPKTSLGLGFVAAQLEDILWAAAILVGLEHARLIAGFLPASPLDLYDFPWTHGLVPAIALSWFFYRITKVPALGLCVFSHWILDLIAHVHDLPVLRHGPYLGLGLWRSQAATFLTETGLLLFGLLLYMRATRAKSFAGRIAVPALVLTLILGDAASVYGPPPPSMKILAATGEITYILLALLATWLDRFRLPLEPSSAQNGTVSVT